MKREIEELKIAPDATILHAMEQMDQVGHKLLMVFDAKCFVGLISIGSLQRALINGATPGDPIRRCLRTDMVLCTNADSEDKIRAEMLRCRAEYMPIVQGNAGDGFRKIVNVVFWDDLFGEQKQFQFYSSNYDLPVVVMAGGEGTRLRPLTNILPKPLLPIGQKTIIESIMDRFVEIGSRRFFISLNYMADTIERYLTEHNDGRYEFTFFREDRPMGSGGSLSLIRDKISETFFVTNCDNILQQDLSEIVNAHRQNKNEMTVVAAVKAMRLPYGNLKVKEQCGGERVVGVEEKPELLFRVNTGVYVMEPHLMDEVPNQEYFPITDLMDRVLLRGGRIGCFPITDGSWCDIGNWDDYTKVLGRS